MPILRRLAVPAAALAMLALPTNALATGGSSIASAPAVTYGVQLIGNTATDGGKSCGTSGRSSDSWWLLPVGAGDVVTINWEGPGANYVRVWPVGTDDFNVNKASYLTKSRLGSNGRQQTIVTAPQAGNLPLEFSTYDCNFGQDVPAGPYAFTATVQPYMPNTGGGGGGGDPFAQIPTMSESEALRLTKLAIRIRYPGVAGVSAASCQNFSRIQWRCVGGWVKGKYRYRVGVTVTNLLDDRFRHQLGTIKKKRR